MEGVRKSGRSENGGRGIWGIRGRGVECRGREGEVGMRWRAAERERELVIGRAHLNTTNFT